MKQTIATLLLFFYLQSGYASDLVHNTGNSEQHREVVQFFKDYISDYNEYLSDSENLSAISTVTQRFHMPLMQLIPQASPRVAESREQLGKGLQSFLDGLKAKGVDRLEWEKVQVHLTADDTAVASNRANALKADGSVVKRSAALYLLHKTEDVWQITVFSPQSTDNILRFNSEHR